MSPRARQSKPHTVKRLPMTKVRHNLGALVKGVRLRNEYVVLEKDGIPVAALMDIDEFEDYLELQDPKIQAHIRKSRQEHRAGMSFPAEDLVPKLERVAERVWKKPGRRRAANE